MTEIDHGRRFGSIDFRRHRNRQLIVGRRRGFGVQFGGLLIKKMFGGFDFRIVRSAAVGFGVGFAHQSGFVVAAFGKQFAAPLRGPLLRSLRR